MAGTNLTNPMAFVTIHSSFRNNTFFKIKLTVSYVANGNTYQLILTSIAVRKSSFPAAET